MVRSEKGHLRAGSATSLATAIHYLLIFLALSGYAYLGVYRAMPFNLKTPANITHRGGAIEAAVLGHYRYAKKVQRDENLSVWGDLADHLVFRGHNPGMFVFMAVLSYDLGLRSLFSIQMLPLALNTLTLLILYLFFRKLFRQRWIGLFATIFIAFCPAFLTQATTLGSGSYAKLFQAATLLCFLSYLRGDKRVLLHLTFLFYFLACWNYWEWYVGTGIMLLGLHYMERGELLSRDLVVVACAPVAAFLSFMALMAARWGGLGSALVWLRSVVMYRVLDQPHPAGYFKKAQPNTYLNSSTLGEYLSTIGERIEEWYYLPPEAFALMLAAVLFAHSPSRERSYRFVLFLIPAAFYWNVLMLQHSLIHFYTALQYYLLMGLIFGCFVVEIPQYLGERLGERPFRKLIIGLVLFAAIYPVLSGMTTYISERQALYREQYKENLGRLKRSMGQLPRRGDADHDQTRAGVHAAGRASGERDLRADRPEHRDLVRDRAPDSRGDAATHS